ncbi:MAG: hypothetical protein NT068_00405 [Candidatus Nomurabacteria bacterium]|nr:hypothetical protein [Candidatus Nomurabacteria bacterium]
MNNTEIQNLIKEIIQNMNISVLNIDVLKENNSQTTWYSVSVDQPHFFTSREGEALHSLNHLIRRIVENSSSPDKERCPEDGEVTPPRPSGTPPSQGEKTVEGILIDIDGFHKKRVENVRAVAHMIAERARYFQSSVEVDPMSAFDRRIVHEYVSNSSDLKSESTGYGPTRRVVIKYIGNI